MTVTDRSQSFLLTLFIMYMQLGTLKPASTVALVGYLTPQCLFVYFGAIFIRYSIVHVIIRGTSVNLVLFKINSKGPFLLACVLNLMSRGTDVPSIIARPVSSLRRTISK